ncbi:hypothetical protein [Thermocatellispora tengchongensis]
MMMRDGDRVSRYNRVFVPDRVAHMRWQRTHPKRQYLVPYVEVVVDATGASYEDTRATVDGVLAGSLHDLQVTLVGPWSTLAEDRRSPQYSPNLDLLLVHGLYRHDGRVRYVERLPESAAPTPYRLTCPPGWVPGPDSLRRMVALAADQGYGLISVALDETDVVVTARLEHTGAYARARLVAAPGEPLDDAVEDVAGTYWVDGATWGWLPAAEAPEPKAQQPARPAPSGKPGQEVVRLREENARLERRIAQLTDELERVRLSASRPRRRRLPFPRRPERR